MTPRITFWSAIPRPPRVRWQGRKPSWWHTGSGAPRGRSRLLMTLLRNIVLVVCVLIALCALVWLARIEVPE